MVWLLQKTEFMYQYQQTTKGKNMIINISEITFLSILFDDSVKLCVLWGFSSICVGLCGSWLKIKNSIRIAI